MNESFHDYEQGPGNIIHAMGAPAKVEAMTDEERLKIQNGVQLKLMKEYLLSKSKSDEEREKIASQFEKDDSIQVDAVHLWNTDNLSGNFRAVVDNCHGDIEKIKLISLDDVINPRLN